jgi:hypothetical protein
MTVNVFLSETLATMARSPITGCTKADIESQRLHHRLAICFVGQGVEASFPDKPKLGAACQLANTHYRLYHTHGLVATAPNGTVTVETLRGICFDAGTDRTGSWIAVFPTAPVAIVREEWKLYLGDLQEIRCLGRPADSKNLK